MNTIVKTASVVSALGAIALIASTAHAGTATPKMEKAAVEKCYGVAKAGKNDCAGGANSCAGHAMKDMDKGAFVALPKGACAKLAGGSLTPGK